MSIQLGHLTKEEALEYLERFDESTLNVLCDVMEEREFQDNKWGDIPQRVNDGLELTDWVAILTEEVGEFSEATLHDKFGGERASAVNYEAIQVTAVGVAILEFLQELERRADAS